jgi:hypothetical protein
MHKLFPACALIVAAAALVFLTALLVGCGGASSPPAPTTSAETTTAPPDSSVQDKPPQVAPQYLWSAYATVVIRVAPGTSLGWQSYVELGDGKGRYWSGRAPSNGVAPSVSFSGVYVDKTLRIRVTYADGRSWYYYRPAGRPWGSTRTITVFYGGSSSG